MLKIKINFETNPFRLRYLQVRTDTQASTVNHSNAKVLPTVVSTMLQSGCKWTHWQVPLHREPPAATGLPSSSTYSVNTHTTSSQLLTARPKRSASHGHCNTTASVPQTLLLFLRRRLRCRIRRFGCPDSEALAFGVFATVSGRVTSSASIMVMHKLAICSVVPEPVGIGGHASMKCMHMHATRPMST